MLGFAIHPNVLAHLKKQNKQKWKKRMPFVNILTVQRARCKTLAIENEIPTYVINTKYERVGTTFWAGPEEGASGCSLVCGKVVK